MTTRELRVGGKKASKWIVLGALGILGFVISVIYLKQSSFDNLGHAKSSVANQPGPIQPSVPTVRVIPPPPSPVRMQATAKERPAIDPTTQQANGAPIEAISLDFDMSPAALRFFKISDAGALIIKERLVEFRSEMSEIAKKHIEKIENGDESVNEYRMTSFWPEPLASLQRLEMEIRPLAGDHDDILLESLGLNRLFGNMGKHDVTFKFIDEPGGIRIEKGEFDPKSGRRISLGTMSGVEVFSRFKKQYGDVFDLVEE